MKKYSLSSVKYILVGLLILATSGIMQAQHGHGNKQSPYYSRQDSGLREPGIPNLTGEQEKKIAALRAAHQKEMTGFRNDMAIKEAELQKYRSADKPDMVLINKTIDEIGRLFTEMKKKRVGHEMAVRDLLTDEQKLVFDAHRNSRGFHDGRGGCTPCNLPHGPGMPHGGRGYRM